MISINTEYKTELDYYSMLTESYGLKITKQGLSSASSQGLDCTFPYFLRKETIFVADSMTVSPQRAWMSDGMGMYHISLLWRWRCGHFHRLCCSSISSAHCVLCWTDTKLQANVLPESFFFCNKNLWVAFGPLEGDAHADESSLRL